LQQQQQLQYIDKKIEIKEENIAKKIKQKKKNEKKDKKEDKNDDFDVIIKELSIPTPMQNLVNKKNKSQLSFESILKPELFKDMINKSVKVLREIIYKLKNSADSFLYITSIIEIDRINNQFSRLEKLFNEESILEKFMEDSIKFLNKTKEYMENNGIKLTLNKCQQIRINLLNELNNVMEKNKFMSLKLNKDIVVALRKERLIRQSKLNDKFYKWLCFTNSDIIDEYKANIIKSNLDTYIEELEFIPCFEKEYINFWKIIHTKIQNKLQQEKCEIMWYKFHLTKFIEWKNVLEI
jgi:hypothetical protein